MKLAICGFGFSGATLPLAKALAHSASIIKKVDCYYLVYKSKKCSEIESVDYGNELLKIGIPHKLDKSNKIYNYLPDNVSIYLFPLCPNGPVGMHWFSKILNYCKYPLNAVLHISKKYCTFARRHHFSNFETRIRNLALHQHKLMEAIP